jgi:hypothetical protein
MQPIDFFAAVRDATGETTPERVVVRAKLSLSLIEQLNRSHRPEAIPDRPAVLRNHSTQTLIEAMEHDSSLARELCGYRVRVTELEAQNSKRLETLVWCKFELEALRELVEEPSDIDHALQRLQFFLRGTWRTEIPEEPKAVRLWAIRETYDYEALPREWRYL